MCNGLVCKQEVIQFLIKRRILAAYPFEDHRRMLFFLVPVMREDCRKLGILRGVDALVVPVNGLELFH